MISYDTIKLQVPTSCLLDYDTKSFNLQKQTITNKEGEMYDRYISKAIKGYGVGHTTFEPLHDKLVFSISEKALCDDYLIKGITTNTITQALENYNKFAPFTLKINEVIDKAMVLTCDTTQMIKPKYNTQLCRDAMLSFSVNNKYPMKVYNGHKGMGIEFNGSVKTEKRRLIMYDKHAELMKNSTSVRAFLNRLKNPQKVVNRAKGKLRIEQNHTSKKSMRKRFNVHQPYLLYMLESKENPNRDFMEKVKETSVFVDAFGEDLLGGTMKEIRDRLGRIALCELFHNQLPLVEHFLKTKYKGNGHYKELRECKNMIAYQLHQARAKKNPKLKKSEMIINHVFDLINRA